MCGRCKRYAKVPVTLPLIRRETRSVVTIGRLSLCIACRSTSEVSIHEGQTRLGSAELTHQRLGIKCNYNYDIGPRTSSIDELQLRYHPRFIPERRSVASLLAALDSIGGPHSPTITQLLAAGHINWRAKCNNPHFPSIHRWLSIPNWVTIATIFGVQNDIDATTLFEQLQVPAADAALLLVCVWLSTQYVGPHKAGSQIEYPLYKAVKRTFTLLKCLMPLTIGLMQCGALITLVEYGHGLFVTAHETLSETAAMARIFGLTPEKYVEEDATRPWTVEEEEASTLWWCLFELDQYALPTLSLSAINTHLTDRRLIHQDATAKHLPFVVPTPAADDLLPPNRVGDISCSATSPLRLPLSAPVHITVGDRPRSAQSAVVLHRALLWESRWTFRDENGTLRPLPINPSYSDMDLDPSLTTSVRDHEQDSLDAAIRAILQAMVNQTDRWEIFCDCFSMCLSAMYTLYVPSLPAVESLLDHLPPNVLSRLLLTAPDTPHARECKALAALNFSGRFMSDLSRAFNKGVESHPSKLAEMVVAPAIQTCGISLEVFLRLGEVVPDAREGLEGVRRAVLYFTTRWGLAGEFLLC